MHRRQLLVFGAAALAASSLPAMATIEPTENTRILSIETSQELTIEQAINATEAWGFSMRKQSLTFGIDPDFVNQRDDLVATVRELVIGRNNWSVTDRVEYVLEIKQRLDAHFGANDIRAQRAWIHSDDWRMNCSVIELMTGSRGDLEHVAYTAARSIS